MFRILLVYLCFSLSFIPFSIALGADGPGEYKCEVCKAPYDDEGHLTKHYNRKHSDVLREGYIKCKTCTGQFLPKNIKDHSAHCKGALKDFKCSVCETSVGSQAALTHHYNEKHKDVPRKGSVKCPSCSNWFPVKSFKNHSGRCSGISKQYKCPIVGCSITFKDEPASTGHYNLKHSDIPREGYVKCTYCPGQFLRSTLGVHVTRCPGRSVRVAKEKRPAGKKTKKDGSIQAESKPQVEIRCEEPDCPLTFTTQGALTTHYNRFHPGVEREGFINCWSCSKQVLRKNLVAHAVKCTNSQRDGIPRHSIKCPECDQTVKTFRQFLEHIKEDHASSKQFLSLVQEHVENCKKCREFKVDPTYFTGELEEVKNRKMAETKKAVKKYIYQHDKMKKHRALARESFPRLNLNFDVASLRDPDSPSGVLFNAAPSLPGPDDSSRILDVLRNKAVDMSLANGTCQEDQVSSMRADFYKEFELYWKLSERLSNGKSGVLSGPESNGGGGVAAAPQHQTLVNNNDNNNNSDDDDELGYSQPSQPPFPTEWADLAFPGFEFESPYQGTESP